jgi:hypothetical protein
MGLSAGGFFKNFVKGAAQQYNTNIAYVEQQKIEEERAKKKEERQFGYDKTLKEMEYGLRVDVETAKSEANKSYLGRYPMKNGKTFDIPMMTGYKSLADKTAKYESAFKAYSPHIPNLDTLKKELTPIGYQNLLSSMVKNYKGMSTVDDGSVQGTEAKVIYDSNYYKNMQSNDDLFETFSKEVGMDAEMLRKYLQANDSQAVLAQKPILKTNRFGSPELTIPGFYGAGEDKPFNARDIQIAATSILNTGSDKEVIAWMNNKHDFMKTQEIKGVIFSGSDLIEGIASAKKAVGTLNLTDVTELTPRVGKAIRKALLDMGAVGKNMANDPQVMHEIIKNSIPKKRNPKLMQIAGGPVQYNNESFLVRVFGEKNGKVLVNSAQKAEKSGVRLARAKEMVSLIDTGARTGLAAKWQAGTLGFIEQAKELMLRMSGFKSGDNDLGSTQKRLTDKLDTLGNRVNSQSDPIERDRIVLDALLEYETTLMVFDIATMAQDAGGGLDSSSGAVRLSDADVNLSSRAIQKTLFQNPESTKKIAMKIAELAEQEMFIYSMLSRGTVEDAQAGLIMMDAYRGELGALIQNIRPERLHEYLGVEKVTTPKFVFDPNININKDKVALPKGKKLKTQ